jgi:superfamily II DNA/RNA helicase
MSKQIKNQQDILNKLKIKKLNPMQEKASAVIQSENNIMLLSPTGTGKTLAFLLPVIELLDPECLEIQVVIVVPSRELAIQIEQVIREMGTGYKANAVYGGRSGSQDKLDLNHRPAILIGTPGRMADHLRKESFPVEFIQTMVLDEFDKSLEIGFEKEMMEIVDNLFHVKKKILTSATLRAEMPAFLSFTNPVRIDYLQDAIPALQVKTLVSPDKDKLETLFKTLCHLGNQPGIIFCNFKESIQRVSDFLASMNIAHGCFFGGMEQQDRERVLIKFRNGTYQLLIATDLAARGIDIPEIKFIIHYQLPLKSHEFIHRNGRTARMHQQGTAYVMRWEREDLPPFIYPKDQPEVIEEIKEASIPDPSLWGTLYITGGRRDKISKGDIVGLFLKQGGLPKDALGMIEIKQENSFVAVHADRVEELIKKVNNARLKTKRVRVSRV